MLPWTPAFAGVTKTGRWRVVMWYYPAAFLVGKRDVIGAWLVCLIVAAVCFGSPMLTAASDPPAAARHAAASCQPAG
jgi:hypothetical protein